MKVPPLLPEETFHRVMRVANRDGLSVMAVAGMLALAAASIRDFSGAAVGLAVAAAGAMELHGAGLLRAGERRGMKWILVSQPYLMAVLLAYCAVRLATFDAAVLQEAVTDDLRQKIAEAGFTEERMLRQAYTLMYGLLAIGTVIYQGAMTLYYWRRRSAVEAAAVDDNRFA
ncbi:MAG TPA: hypothetical protein VEA63_06285 [Opitutus sp.]|jgi:hypothetical protein|nr:hypothetical protein [Opitutus sp.]